MRGSGNSKIQTRRKVHKVERRTTKQIDEEILLKLKMELQRLAKKHKFSEKDLPKIFLTGEFWRDGYYKITMTRSEIHISGWRDERNRRSIKDMKETLRHEFVHLLQHREAKPLEHTKEFYKKKDIIPRKTKVDVSKSPSDIKQYIEEHPYMNSHDLAFTIQKKFGKKITTKEIVEIRKKQQARWY